MKGGCRGWSFRVCRWLGAVALTAPVILVAPGRAHAQLSDLEQESVDIYSGAVRSVESGAATGSLENAFYALAPVREALTRPRDSRWTLVESLSSDEFERLRSELPGVTIIRDDIVFVGPDPDYFIKLAETKGDAADRAFFAALKATYTNAVWPVYLEQKTNAGGCTRFGSGTLVGTLRAWLDFQQRFPGRYVIPARREVERVQSALVQSTCACGDRSSAVQEIDTFLETFPTSAIRPQLLERVEALRSGRSDIRASCTAE
jgi:hypothetical protein